LNQTKVRGSIYVLMAATSYGLLSPLIKMAYADGVGHQALSAGMLMAAMLFFWVPLLWKRKQLKRLQWKPEIRPLAITGVMGLGLTTLFINKALEMVDASLGIVLLFQFTWIVFVIDYLVTGSRPTKWKWVAIILILIGTIFSVGLIGARMGPVSPVGVLFGFMSGISYAVFLYFIGRIAPNTDVLIKSAVMTTSSFLFLGTFLSISILQTEAWGTFWFWVLIIGFFGPVLPTFLFNLGAPLIGGTLAGMLGAFELPVTLIASAILIGEQISMWQWLGISLIFIGIVISERE
jgi:drug/metabolite transporter (DMT)-like permease